ncbi:uncharacterized protein [Mytilus edulis]|uniref:uncharacterized protein n=1 Tax=Mytilus edulis TaxID=6550 RepID=UPI0039F0868A
MLIKERGLIPLFLLSITDAVLVYEIRCPGRSEKRLLSNRCPNPSQFHCLLTAADEVYKSECRNREWVIKGNYPVRRGFRQYIDYEPCPIDRYQSFVFWSNGDHQCSMLKSLCSEKGQVQYDNGTSTSDKRCNCDTASGYVFAVPPKNKRFCVSSEEDCSCLQKTCMDLHRQNADNDCARREMIETYTVSTTGHKRMDIKEEHNSTKQISRFTNTIHIKSEGILFYGMAVFLIIVTIMFDLMVIISVAFCRLELLCQREHEKRDTVLPKIDFVNRGKQLILSDIIILHNDEDYYNFAIYKGHLKFIAKQFGHNDVTIESFKDVFPSTEKIPLREVIKQCKFLFLYVSGIYFPSEVAMYGLNEKEINSVLMLPKKITKYPSIKTVCAYSNFIYSEIDLDYYNYKNEKTIRESYKETFKLILESIKK